MDLEVEKFQFDFRIKFCSLMTKTLLQKAAAKTLVAHSKLFCRTAAGEAPPCTHNKLFCSAAARKRSLTTMLHPRLELAHPEQHHLSDHVELPPSRHFSSAH